MKQTKFKLIIGLALGLMTAFNGCEHESIGPKYCGVENPKENLPWLKDLIKNNVDAQTAGMTSIDLYKYNSEDLIQLSWKPQPLDHYSGGIYDCTGKLKYTCELFKTDSCDNVIRDGEFIMNLWKKE